MKKFILLIVLIFIGYNSFSQGLTDRQYLYILKYAYRDYLEFCNVIVQDSVTQEGSINERRVPVYKDNKVISYQQVTDKDTIWEPCKCPQYKREDVWEYYNQNLVYLSNGNVGIKIGKEVTRQVKCNVLQEKPSQEGFYEWLYIQLIK